MSIVFSKNFAFCNVVFCGKRIVFSRHIFLPHSFAHNLLCPTQILIVTHCTKQLLSLPRASFPHFYSVVCFHPPYSMMSSSKKSGGETPILPDSSRSAKPIDLETIEMGSAKKPPLKQSRKSNDDSSDDEEADIHHPPALKPGTIAPGHDDHGHEIAPTHFPEWFVDIVNYVFKIKKRKTTIEVSLSLFFPSSPLLNPLFSLSSPS